MFKCHDVQVHNLSGPVAVTDASGEPAHPGDLLMVEICNLGPLPGDEWGFTGTFDRENGGVTMVCQPLAQLCSILIALGPVYRYRGKHCTYPEPVFISTEEHFTEE